MAGDAVILLIVEVICLRCIVDRCTAAHIKRILHHYPLVQNLLLPPASNFAPFFNGFT